MVSGIAMLEKLATTLAEHAEVIRAWCDCRTSIGPLDVTNNKIKTLRRRASGYRDRDLFELRIYNLQNKRYELVG